jgi:uncharacterized Zn finger protein (UPF0148 family)
MTQAFKRLLERKTETEFSITNFKKNIVERIQKQKSTYKACPTCGSKISIKFVTKVECVCCGSKEFGFTNTDESRLTRLKEVLKEINKEISKTETKQATKKKKVTAVKVSKPVIIPTSVEEEMETVDYTAYITEYDAEGEPQDSFKEWFTWEYPNEKPTKIDAANILGYPVGDIQMLQQMD